MQGQRLFILGIFVIVCASLPLLAMAQDQQANIENRLESLGSTAPRVFQRPDEAILTGREDLVLLIRRQLFEAYMNTAFQYTNNAFLSNNNRQHDKVAMLTGGLRFSTLVAYQINVFADLSVSGARYGSNDQLDYNVIQGSAGASYINGPWVVSLSYTPSYVYDDNMKDHLVSLHRLAGYASYSIIARDNLVFSPYLSLQATPSDPNEYGFYQGDVGVQAIVGLPHSLRLTAGPRMYVKKYFDYFERVIGESRTDTGMGFNVNLDWSPNPNVSLSFGSGFTSNSSTLDGNDYDAFTASPSLRLSVKF